MASSPLHLLALRYCCPFCLKVLSETHGLESSRYATDVAGIYAVGDIRSGSVKRVASAMGEGSAVVADMHRYLAAFEETPVSAGASSMSARWLGFNSSPTSFGDNTEARLTEAIM